MRCNGPNACMDLAVSMQAIDSDQPIRPASSMVVWRNRGQEPEILMGQRDAKAVFMPSKYVFPGGAVDIGDNAPAEMLSPACMRRLSLLCAAGAPGPQALTGTALRELVEEAGLRLHATGRLQFIFRAITPPGRSRRFDARFFLAPASDLTGDADDFSSAEDELSHLHWIGLSEARRLDLPFITEVVIAEVAALLKGQEQPGVPFFDNSGDTPTFRRLV